MDLFIELIGSTYREYKTNNPVKENKNFTVLRTTKGTGTHTMRDKSISERCPGCGDPKHSHCELVDMKIDMETKIGEIKRSDRPGRQKGEMIRSLRQNFDKQKRELTKRKHYHEELENHETHVAARIMNNQPPLINTRTENSFRGRRNYSYNNNMYNNNILCACTCCVT